LVREKLFFLICNIFKKYQGGHKLGKPGKPGILRDFSEDGKLREFCEYCSISGENCNKQSILVRH